MPTDNPWVAPTPSTPKPPAAAPRPDALPGPYTTQLPAEDETKFQSWVKENKVPWQDHPQSDYDMRGYWQAQQSGDPEAKQAENKHFPDTYKTPYHKSFSNESKYATDAAPKWKGNKLVDKNGSVVFDEDATPNDLEAKTQKNAKAALPKMEENTDSPAEAVIPGASKVSAAYDAAKSWLSEHSPNLSEKVLAPFRQGLDNMAEDLETAGETGHTKSGGALNSATRALASGTGAALKMVPVGKDVKETAQMALTPPEFAELGVTLHPEQIIKEAGLVYKGEMVPTSKLHMFEHPDHPGKTASLFEHEITPDAVKSKIDGKLKEFADGEKAKAVKNNASGESAASQEAINRGASEKKNEISYSRIDSRSKIKTPLSSIDGVDAKPGPHDWIVKHTKTGDILQDSGEKARPYSGQDAAPKTEIKTESKSGQKLKVSKEDSKLAADYISTLKKSK